MTTQLELISPMSDKSATIRRQSAWLERCLLDSGEWQCSRQLLTLSPEPLNDRELRNLASQSQWLISGQHGYKHLRHATAEEIHHATAWLESQAQKMSERAATLRRNAHRLLN